MTDIEKTGAGWSSSAALPLVAALNKAEALAKALLQKMECPAPLHTEELTLRENRRVRMTLIVTVARLSAIKTLARFDFSFQPSMDKIASWRSPSCSSSTALKSST